MPVSVFTVNKELSSAKKLNDSYSPPAPQGSTGREVERMRVYGSLHGRHSRGEGRGSLHGRHSQGEGMIMHSTAAQVPSPLPDNAHAPPNHPAVPFTGGATLDGHRVRRGTGACARMEQAPAPS